MRLLAAVALLACRSRSEPPAPTPPAPPADASLWAGDTLALAAGDGPIGTADPIHVVETDPQRRWVLVCQGRLGARAHWHLVLGGGTGTPLDGVYAVSRDGEHLVVGIAGEVALVDVTARRATRWPGAGELATFSLDGKRAIVLEPGTPAHLARRDLATGAIDRVVAPAGDAGFMTADTTGTAVLVAVAATHFGDFAWRRQYTCRAGDPSIADLANDPIEKVWVDLDHGTIHKDSTIVRVTAGHVLAQDGAALTLDGKRYGPACTALTVLGVVESPFDALIYCKPASGAEVLTLVGHPALRLPGKMFGFASTGRYADMLPDREQCLALDAEDTCVDLATGKTHKQARPPMAIGVHDGVEWYDGTPTHLLVGSPDHGPLTWQPRP